MAGKKKPKNKLRSAKQIDKTKTQRAWPSKYTN